MTASARIRQADVQRIVAGVLAAGVKHFRLAIDFTGGTVDVVIGDDLEGASITTDGWDDDE